MSEATPSYDVAFSYAREDREYVERVAAALATRARVFYDRDEQIDLWGRDLRTRLAEIYGRRARFCVLFISKHYADKAWPNHERATAQARVQREPGMYILPARFDDTPVPGLPDSLAHIDLRELPPEAFAELLLRKIRSHGRLTSRWVAAASAGLSAALAAGAILLWPGSVARAAPDGGTAGAAQAANPRDSVVQKAEAKDANSSVTVEGGMTANVTSGTGQIEQRGSASNGGSVVIKGGMHATAGGSKNNGTRPRRRP